VKPRVYDLSPNASLPNWVRLIKSAQCKFANYIVCVVVRSCGGGLVGSGSVILGYSNLHGWQTWLGKIVVGELALGKRSWYRKANFWLQAQIVVHKVFPWTRILDIPQSDRVCQCQQEQAKFVNFADQPLLPELAIYKLEISCEDHSSLKPQVVFDKVFSLTKNFLRYSNKNV